ncbi:MAG: integrase/recombinase XerD [Methanolobus sp.]|jgi:integrase|nr:integrase/recombinase XerD [Methanolobus sp.]
MCNNSNTDKTNAQLSTKICGKNPEPPLTFEDDIMPMINACVTPQHEAILRLFFDSAIRGSELMSMNIGDVVQEGDNIRIVVNGKLGVRVIPLSHISIPIIEAWLNDHPLRDDGSAPLFGTTNSNGFDFRRLGGSTLSTIIETLCKRAGIDKPITPHQIRHSRLIQIATDIEVADEILRKFAGWSSHDGVATMPITYQHLTKDEISDVIGNGKEY